MTFQSILFNQIDDRADQERSISRIFFVDLNLDQVIDAITGRKQDYNLKPFFYAPYARVESVKYRQEVFRDL